MSSPNIISTKYDQIISKGKAILQEEAQAILTTGIDLGESFYHAVEMITECKGKIVVTGIGKSGWIGRKISSTMSSLGIPAVYMSPAEGLHGDLGIVQKDDIVLAISKSGESQEISDILPTLKKIESKMIAITANENSTMGKHADIVLTLSIEREACHMNLAPTTSTTVTLALGDALALVVSEQIGFTSNDFALYHPGGSLGKRLTLNVEDLLASDSYTFVSIDDKFQDIVMELTKRPLGGTVVLDHDKKMIGIITDGDLRRSIEKHGEHSFQLKASEIMTKNPIVINKGITAGQAIQVMEKNQREISVIPVMDKNEYVGMLRLHDILKLG
ncbi:KpsF/GutQ family sugar-phosphate isomerase [Metabacillus sediminilitoris]|uniref:KpsF/GutQ family sugar-phosphate isomerase n=1 Tax=Metabacillus sediminilitoris TaxID=2567941 RepID=A0A4S4C1F4_9BACI|nr:KpsF/GutQ family sugar-phosphate isomerase [Metabacillus sediminilitoris]QGQ48165.1 KpsF/GutQ family sugar-phosphate isomerase [Metabacillus sediminilitoris]THF81472.1 KpsF/GutQ family sugar-phosphate isomerase [Metabacillus sediminilitoris]